MQDDTLLAGSIAENIALFDEKIDMERVHWAAQTACIADDIERMPMSYRSLVGDMGTTLSGGQQQRIMLARALYRQPKVLVMDEGTAHLDVESERRINAALRQLNITRIAAAHRQETIAAADRILVMQGRKTVQENRTTSGVYETRGYSFYLLQGDYKHEYVLVMSFTMSVRCMLVLVFMTSARCVLRHCVRDVCLGTVCKV